MKGMIAGKESVLGESRERTLPGVPPAGEQMTLATPYYRNPHFGS
jgi:hypothetical protein